jgi:hypothetical protein
MKMRYEVSWIIHEDDEQCITSEQFNTIEEAAENYKIKKNSQEVEHARIVVILDEYYDHKGECKVTKIDNILTKYENFYKGGSGYTFQVEVDDFNELLQMITGLEEANKDLAKQVIEHCETKGLLGRQVFALTKRVDELVEERKVTEKNTVAKILAYVEKNHDEPEIEEYLWKMLDKGTEFELKAETVEPPRISIKPEKSGTPLTE